MHRRPVLAGRRLGAGAAEPELVTQAASASETCGPGAGDPAAHRGRARPGLAVGRARWAQAGAQGTTRLRYY